MSEARDRGHAGRTAVLATPAPALPESVAAHQRGGGSSPQTDVPRMIAVWCPDWPVTAVRLQAKVPASTPLAVFSAGRVLACSVSAREAGVRRGHRRREALARCPGLLAAVRDEVIEARAFEPVVRAIEALAPGVEISRPGLAAIGARGPSRYFGSEEQVIHVLAREIAAVVGALTTDVLFGVADGAFAAEQAARHAAIVEPGRSPQFLAGLPITTLGDPDLVHVLRRLGLQTLGAFAQLSAQEVLARFGPMGAWAHRQASGRDSRVIAGRMPATEFTRQIRFEPALERVDTVAFSARQFTEDFIQGLANRGLACTCFELSTVTEDGQDATRHWRHSGVVTASTVLDRIRWQLEGWLSPARDVRGHPARRGTPAADPPHSGIALLRLTPIDTVPVGAHQQPLWGGPGAHDERAHRALARVQSTLGHGGVVTTVIGPGRDPLQRTVLVPWGEDRNEVATALDALDAQGSADASAGREVGGNPATTGPLPTDLSGRRRSPRPPSEPSPPWPGHLPAPAPSVLLDPPRPIQVLDTAGQQVRVTDRAAVPMPPASLVSGGTTVPITAWAGPWPVDERWWQDTSTAPLSGRRSRFQLVDVHGRAYLAVCQSRPRHDSGGGVPDDTAWVLEGIYD